MHIETERLLIRSFTDADLPCFAAIQADPEVMRHVGGVQSFDVSTHQLATIIAGDQTHGIARYAVERKAMPGFIGYCGFKPAGDFVDLGYQYAQAAWGQGLGLEAALAVRTHGLTQLGITNMEAGGAVANVASVKIMQRLNFRHHESVLFEGTPSIRFFD